MSCECTINVYLDSATDAMDKIARYDAIINGLITAAQRATANEDVEEYFMDDGQQKIRYRYRTASDAFKAIINFKRLRYEEHARLFGRTRRLVPQRNFIGRNRY